MSDKNRKESNANKPFYLILSEVDKRTNQSAN